MFNRNEFKAQLARQGLNVSTLAENVGLDPATLYRKMNGEVQFTVGDVEEIRDALKLGSRDVLSIFFAQ